jgi:methionyl aminopeptidase
LVIEMKTAAEVAKMRAAGLVVGNTLQALRDLVAPGVTTKDLDVEAERLIRAAGAVPSFPPRSARRSTRRSCTASRARPRS